MEKPKSPRITRSAGKTAGRKRAAPTANWLGFIRPHFEVYRMLPWGGQRAFIDKLARAEGQSANTLRRYIAAAEFLESFGISKFPEGIVHVPVASVEAIARISKLAPARGRALLDDLTAGMGTIRGYKEELSYLKKTRTGTESGLDIKRISFMELLRELPFFRVYERTREVPGMRFSEWPGPSALFATAAWPLLVFPFERGDVVVFDEAKLVWARSPNLVRREFIRNIAVAATMFEAVFVYCNVLKADVERIAAAMLKDCRSRILIRYGVLDFPIG
jgi:hypothetical protein